jgi:flagellar biosynthesis/type III secretory pathway protein FliH
MDAFLKKMPTGKPLKGLRISYIGKKPVPGDEAAETAKAEYKRGYQKAREFYERKIVNMQKEMAALQDQVLNKIEGNIKSLEKEINGNLPDLIMAIVRKIWNGMEVDHATLIRLIEEVLDQVSPGEEGLEVYLCPSDYGRLLQNDSGVSSRYPGLKIVEDKALSSGDVALRSRFGHVDARIQTKFRKMCEELKGA